MNTQYFLKPAYLVFAILTCHSLAIFGQEAKSENIKIITDQKDLVEGTANSEFTIAWSALEFPGANPTNFSIPSSIEEIKAKHRIISKGGLQFLMKTSGSGTFLIPDVIIVKKTERLTEPSKILIEPFEPFHSISGSYWYFTDVVLLPIGSEIVFKQNPVNFYGIGFSNGKILIHEQGIKVISGTFVSKNIDQQKHQDQTETHKIGISSMEDGSFTITESTRGNQNSSVKMEIPESTNKSSEKKENEKFFNENKRRPSLQTTVSGLQYEVIRIGNGDKPQQTSKVKVHYHGTLINGTVFDSSVERGEPNTFRVNHLIKGLQEALQLMPAGSKWKLYIPYNLAYGEKGFGTKIKPFSTLIFEVELLELLIN